MEENDKKDLNGNAKMPGPGDDIIYLKCPTCGAPVSYSAESASLECVFCGNKFSPSEFNASGFNPNDDNEGFDWDDCKEEFNGEKLEGTASYECRQCGAEIEVEKNTMATACPYCGNNLVIKSTGTGSLKPNLIIPFMIEKSKVPELFREYASSKERKYVPSDYSKNLGEKEIQGVYVPFWLFHDLRDSAIVPVDASVKMDNKLMDAIEPFDWKGLKNFSSRYLVGWLAERFDSSPEKEVSRASRIICHGSNYSLADERRLENELISRKEFKYALLPVYVFNCKYRGKTYRYVMNGQTGKIAGRLPVSRGRYILRCVVAGIITFCAVTGSCVLPQLFW